MGKNNPKTNGLCDLTEPPSQEVIKSFLDSLLNHALRSCHDNMRQSFAEMLESNGLANQYRIRDNPVGSHTLLLGKDPDKMFPTIRWEDPVFTELEKGKYEYKMVVYG